MTVMLRGMSLLAAVLALGPGTQAWAQGNHPGIAARVNGVEISNERFNAFYQEYRRPYGINVAGRGDHLDKLTRLRREAMDLMVEQELLRQAAEAQGDIEVSSGEIDAALAEVSEPFKTPEEFTRRIESEGFTPDSYREHVARMIAAAKYLDGVRAGVATVSDEELETYYRANEIRLTLPEQVRVRHILLTWKPMGTTDDRAAIRKQMAPILEQARSGEDFAELARKHSDDSTAGQGGDTGFFHRGQMVPAFEAVAFALQPGEVSDPVETPFGVHILRLEERQEARLLPLDEVREQLREHIRGEKMTAAVAEENNRLRQESEVAILIPLERPKDN